MNMAQSHIVQSKSVWHRAILAKASQYDTEPDLPINVIPTKPSGAWRDLNLLIVFTR